MQQADIKNCIDLLKSSMEDKLKVEDMLARAAELDSEELQMRGLDLSVRVTANMQKVEEMLLSLASDA